VAVERIEGVTDAMFSYGRAEGFVTFDSTRTSVDEIVAELERMTGFSATQRDARDGG
jgi:copper chaperone CopZ